MFTFESSTGRLLDAASKVVVVGYSGYHEGKNNPAMQNVHNVGPIPEGIWDIVGEPFDSDMHGPYCLRLQPEGLTETYGRDGFLCHGDSNEHPGEASRGCIILPRWARVQIWAAADRKFKVVAVAA